MTSDTARRHPAQVQAEEKYPDRPDREFVGDGDQSTTRAAFIDGFEAGLAEAEAMVRPSFRIDWMRAMSAPLPDDPMIAVNRALHRAADRIHAADRTRAGLGSLENENKEERDD